MKLGHLPELTLTEQEDLVDMRQHPTLTDGHTLQELVEQTEEVQCMDA